MDNDLIPILGIVLLGGFAVWYLMRKPANPVAPPTPCTVGGTYGGAGVAVSCSELEKGIKAVGDLVTHVIDMPSKLLSSVPGTGGPTLAPLAERVAFANKNGIIFSSITPGSWNVSNGVKLPAGQKNCIAADGKSVILCNMDGSPIVWQGVPPVRTGGDAVTVSRPPSTVPIGSAPTWRK